MALVLSGSIDISGSMTATTIVVSSPGAAGMVSSSAQIGELVPLMQSTSSINNLTGSLITTSSNNVIAIDGLNTYTASLKGAAIVSSSQQITNYYKFAETASANTVFYGNVTASGNFQIGNNTANAMINISGDNGGGDTFLNFKADSDIIKAQIQGGKYGGTAGNLYLKTLKSSVLTTSVTLNHLGDVTIDNGNLIIGTSGKGIDFSATANGAGLSTDSELFNDYEEGRWTPVISDGTNDATMDATYNRGQYIKVGRQVTVTGYVIISSLGSVSGEIRITGLPYVNGGGYGYIAAMIVGTGSSLNITAGYNVTGTVPSSQSYIGLNIWDSAAGTTGLTGAEFSSDGQLQISCTYLTDY